MLLRTGKALILGLVNAAKSGDWDYLKNSAALESTASALIEALPAVDPAVKNGSGAFLGVSSLSELQDLANPRTGGKTHSTADSLANMVGLHVIHTARRATNQIPDNDTMGAALEAVNRSWVNFSLIVGDKTITQAKAELKRGDIQHQAQADLKRAGAQTEFLFGGGVTEVVG